MAYSEPSKRYRKKRNRLILVVLFFFFFVATAVFPNQSLMFMNVDLGGYLAIDRVYMDEYLGTYNVGAGLIYFSKKRINLRAGVDYIFSGGIKQKGYMGELGLGYPLHKGFIGTIFGDVFYRFRKVSFNTRVVIVGVNETLHIGDASSGTFGAGARLSLGDIDSDGYGFISLYFIYGFREATSTQDGADFHAEESGGGVILNFEFKASLFHIYGDVGVGAGAFIANIRCGVGFTL